MSFIFRLTSLPRQALSIRLLLYPQQLNRLKYVNSLPIFTSTTKIRKYIQLYEFVEEDQIKLRWNDPQTPSEYLYANEMNKQYFCINTSSMTQGQGYILTQEFTPFIFLFLTTKDTASFSISSPTQTKFLYKILRISFVNIENFDVCK